MTKKSGLSARKLFKRGEEITYSDFTLLDVFLSETTRQDISLKTHVGKDVYLQTPLIASPMDTVTNAELCIALALEGGIGVMHYNHKKPNGEPDIEAQAVEIARVKRSQNGFIENPVTISPSMTIEQAIQVGEQYNVGNSHIDTFPVTEDGTSNGKLVGLLRKNDYSRVKHTSNVVNDRMLPLDKLVTGEVGITLEGAEEILWDQHLPSIPIVDVNGFLAYLVTRSDIDKREQHPLATVDDSGRLRVLFAAETWEDQAYERLEACFDAGADGVVVDTSQGFTQYAENMINYIAGNFSDKLLIGGNISTAEAANALFKWGIDGYRCGQGSGSICTTAGAIGVSRAGATGIYECAESMVGKKVSTIADGGLRQVGDIVKALAIGADVAMLGNMLAGTSEGPGEVEIDQETGNPIKVYRGMGSKEANVGGVRGYSRLPQGVSGSVPYRGSIHEWVPLIRNGLYSAFETLNCHSITDLHEKMRNEELRFGRRSVGSLKEAGIHGIR
tara:strand:+ start:5875 stop:7380 length:1506 start_codon:yes stop_codon:yes gene_type:complete